MAASPLFSATITTGHLRRTYIGAPSEYSLHSATTKTTCILIIVITNQHHVLFTAAQPQPHHAPHTFHVPGQSHRAHTSLEVMSLGHHKDPRGFTSASFGTIWNTSLLVICSFYYHMLFTITPYMFMFCLYINTPVCCMYFASLNINLATYFSLTHSCLSQASSRLDSRLSYSVRTSEIRGIQQESGTTYKLKPTPRTTLDPTSPSEFRA